MKIIWAGGASHKSHAWEEESGHRLFMGWNYALCGMRVADTNFDDAPTAITCGSCLRILATRKLDNQLQPIIGR